MDPPSPVVVVVLLVVAWFLLSRWKVVLSVVATVLIAVFLFGALELVAQFSLY